MSEPTIDAVLPLRYADCCHDDGTPRFMLQGRTLWDITLDQALAAEVPGKIIVAYDDPAFDTLLSDRGDPITRYQRPETLSESGVTTLDVLANVAAHFGEAGGGADYLMLLEITHPLRPRGIVDELSRAVLNDQPDSLITCHQVLYNFWRKGAEGGMERVRGAGEPGAAPLFQELIGIGSVFRSDLVQTANPFGDRVDVAPIDRFWATVDVRDEDGLWLAEKYLERVDAQL